MTCFQLSCTRLPAKEREDVLCGMIVYVVILCILIYFAPAADPQSISPDITDHSVEGQAATLPFTPRLMKLADTESPDDFLFDDYSFTKPECLMTMECGALDAPAQSTDPSKMYIYQFIGAVVVLCIFFVIALFYWKGKQDIQLTEHRSEIESLRETLSELTLLSNAQEDEIEMLREKQSEKQREIDILKRDNNRLKVQNSQYFEEQKAAETRIQELQERVRELYAETERINVSEFMQWNWRQILKWICSVENRRFEKYEDILQIALAESEIMGDDLMTINQLDIKGWGIRNIKDQKNLCTHIQKLARRNVDRGADRKSSQMVEGLNTDFI